MIVDIFTFTTAKAAKNKKVGFAYVLSCNINGKTATITNKGIYEDIGKNEAEIRVTKEAIERVKPKNKTNDEWNEVHLFTQSPFVAAVLTDWLHKWMKTGTNSKGEPVADIYKELDAITKFVPVKEITQGENEYLKWLRLEAENMITSNDKRSP